MLLVQNEQKATDGKLSATMLKEDVNLILLEKPELEFPKKSKFISFLAFVGYQSSNATSKLNLLSSSTRELSHKPLMQKVRLAVWENYEVEH